MSGGQRELESARPVISLSPFLFIELLLLICRALIEGDEPVVRRPA